jgi:hypothetical protein
LETRDSRYRDQGAQIFAGLVTNTNALTGEKHYGQFYRSSGRYLEFVGAFDGNSTGTSPSQGTTSPTGSGSPGSVTPGGSCTSDADCDGNPCSTGTCDSSGTCSYVDNGTCCCQQFASHCFAGCNGCTGTCGPGTCTETSSGGHCR